MSDYNQFDCHRRFISADNGSVVDNFWDALPSDKMLTLDPDYVFPVFDIGTYRTLFSEVDVALPFDALTDKELELVKLPNGSNECSKAELIKWWGDAIVDHIYKAWDPTKFHLVFHSSGWDSRAVSGAVWRGVREELGWDWDWDDVLFVCIGPESDEFKCIMEYEGWEDYQYVAVTDMISHYDRCLDFHDAWQWLNGPINLGYNMNWVLIEHLQREGLVPEHDDDIQLFTGRNDVVFEVSAGSDCTLKRDYLHNYSAVTSSVLYKVDDLVLPLMSYDVVRTLATSTARVGYASMRRDLVAYMDEGLAKFNRIQDPFPTMEIGQHERAIQDYKESWYGQNVHPSLKSSSAILSYDEWWSRWTCAVIVEHLLEEGYDITIG